MQAMSVFRSWQLDAMKKNLANIERVLTTIIDESVFDKRDGGDGWTISEVMGHLKDVEAIFLQRAKITIEQDNPPLPFSNPDKTVREGGYASQPPMSVYEQWKINRLAFFEYLKSLPDDEDTWERSAQHPNRGKFTLNDQLMLAAWHDTNHLHQIVSIINQ